MLLLNHFLIWPSVVAEEKSVQNSGKNQEKSGKNLKILAFSGESRKNGEKSVKNRGKIR